MRLQQARRAQGAVPDVGFKLTGNVLEYSETRLDLPKGAIAYPIHFLDVLHGLLDHCSTLNRHGVTQCFVRAVLAQALPASVDGQPHLKEQQGTPDNARNISWGGIIRLPPQKEAES